MSIEYGMSIEYTHMRGVPCMHLIYIYIRYNIYIIFIFLYKYSYILSVAISAQLFSCLEIPFFL